MPVTVKTVESRKELRAFVKFPLKLYKGCPHYVPSLFLDEMSSLDMDKNPMGKYAKCEKYLAYNEKGEIVGRVAAIINEIANRDWNHAEVRFGWMDFIDDKEVSKALLEAVIAFGKKHGMNQISGPLGFTDFDNEGCVVEGFDDISSFNLKYNYPYYKDHFEALGLGKVNDWLEYRIFVPAQVPEKVVRSAAIVQERYGLHIRRITKRQVRKEKYGRKIFNLINKAYSTLFDFTVLPDDVIDSYVDTFLGMIDLNYITLVEDTNDNLVGVSLTMPSIAHAAQKCKGFLFPLGWWHIAKSTYLKHEDGLELLMIAVDPEYRNRGVNAIIFNELIPLLIKGGFKYGESNAEMETNSSVQNLWNLYEKEFKRRRRVFSKEI